MRCGRVYNRSSFPVASIFLAVKKSVPGTHLQYGTEASHRAAAVKNTHGGMISDKRRTYPPQGA
jgi:hypothetical protein